MSQPVLVAIDLAHPEHSDAILKRAAAIAALDDAPLAVMSVVPDFGMSIVGSYFKEGSHEEAVESARQTLHGLVDAALGPASGVQHVICHGTAYEQILATADKLQARLIVMGAHRPEFGDFLLGPNTARVVRHAKTSVLVLRDGL